MEDLDFSNFTEVDINSLGTFLRGLAQEELQKLPEKILLTAIRRLGEQTGLPEDKLKARAYLAMELFKVRNVQLVIWVLVRRGGNDEDMFRIRRFVKRNFFPSEF